MRRIAKTFITISVLSVLWGCGKTSGDKLQAENAPEPPAVNASLSSDHLPEKTDVPTVYPLTDPADGNPPAEPSADTKTVAAQPKIETAPHHKTEEAETVDRPSYSAKTPTLVYLSIGDDKKTVTQKYGPPADEYVMEDGNESFPVFEYDGFSVGFNDEGRIQFIEVMSEQVDPGLNGFRLGQTVKDAVKALGKPDTNTEFVLSYKSDLAILKLDVDPKTQIVHSIKLFPNKK